MFCNSRILEKQNIPTQFAQMMNNGISTVLVFDHFRTILAFLEICSLH